MTKLRDHYCAAGLCRLEDFNGHLFWRCLHRHAVPLAPLLARFEVEYFAPDRDLIARATLALTESRFIAAFAEFEGVLGDNPDDFIALYHIGRCAALSGREVDRGVRALQRCLELPAPDGDGMPTYACVHHRLGILFTKKGGTVAAAEAIAAALRAQPDFRPQKIVLRN